MDFLCRIAEERIREAMERGDFDDLALKGKPVEIATSPFVPEDLRLAYKVLQNAGFVPPDVELRRHIRTLKDLLHSIENDDPDLKIRLRRRINANVLKLNLLRRGSVAVEEPEV